MTTHVLNDKWRLYYHLINNNDWSINSYVKLIEFDSLEQTIENYKYIDEDILKKTMLFLMREKINPIWEDENNINGACYSFKIQNKNITNVWKSISYSLVSENLLSENTDKINGISVSPKKFFCILKIWIKDTSLSNVKFLNDNLTNLEYIYKLNNEQNL